MPSKADVLWASRLIIGMRMRAGFGTCRLALSSAPRALLARLTACQAEWLSSGSFPKGCGTYAKWSYSRFSPSVPRIGTKLPIGLSRNLSTFILSFNIRRFLLT